MTGKVMRQYRAKGLFCAPDFTNFILVNPHTYSLTDKEAETRGDNISCPRLQDSNTQFGQASNSWSIDSRCTLH